MAGYFLGIDQGTTLTTAVLAGEHWRIVGKASVPHRQYYPNPGWVEHDAMEIYENCLAVTLDVLKQVPGAKPEHILSLGLDHQGETCVIWEKETGRPISRAIVWQDRRTSPAAGRLKEEHGGSSRSAVFCPTPTTAPPSWNGFWTMWTGRGNERSGASCWRGP